MTDPNLLSVNHRHKPHPADVAQPPDTQTVTAEVTAAERRANEFATHGDPTLAREGVDPVSKRPGMQWGASH